MCLDDGSFGSLVEFRKSELLNGNERVFYELPWLQVSSNEYGVGEGDKSGTSKQKTEIIPLSLDHPAPHPLFIGLPGEMRDLQLCALFLWMLEGSERLLDQIFQFALGPCLYQIAKILEQGLCFPIVLWLSWESVSV